MIVSNNSPNNKSSIYNFKKYIPESLEKATHN